NRQRQHWLENCPQLQQETGSAAAAITFTPLPSPAPSPAPVWQLRWQGLSLPVPALDYDHIGLDPARGTFILVTGDSFGIFTDRPDGFDLASARQQPLLQKLWGPDTTLAQVTAYGYTITPDDLHCTADDLRTQARNAMALTLKTMAEPSAIVAMHQVPGWSTGLLRHGHSDDRGGLESFRYLLQNDPHKAPLK